MGGQAVLVGMSASAASGIYRSLHGMSFQGKALLSCVENLNVAGRYLYRVLAEPTFEENHGYYLYSAISRHLLLWLMWIPGLSVVYALVLKYVLWKNTKESSIE